MNKKRTYIFAILIISILAISLISATVDKTKRWHDESRFIVKINNINLDMENAINTGSFILTPKLRGFYDKNSDDFLVSRECATCALKCKNCGTRSEGWFCDNTFIKYDSCCTDSTNAPYCTGNIPSNFILNTINPGHDESEIWVSINGNEKTLEDALSINNGLCGSNPTITYHNSPSDKSKPYHLAKEVEIQISGSTISLQDAIDSGKFCYAWYTGEWSDWSNTDFCETGYKSGGSSYTVRQREVYCIQASDNSQVSDSYCESIISKPDSEECSVLYEPPEFFPGFK